METEAVMLVVDTSGVAKSSLINVLRSNHPSSDALEKDNWFENRRVGKVSTRGRGKHTTRHVSLLSLSGASYLADTARFNRPNLLKVTRQSLAQAFPNVVDLSAIILYTICCISLSVYSASISNMHLAPAKRQRPMKCSFNNCLHIGEPGCIVKGNWERNSYHFQFLGDQNQRGISIEDIWDQKRVMYTVGDMGVQRAEPQLEPKKHGRQSRKKINRSIVDELNDDDNLHLEIDPIPAKQRLSGIG
ncbi:small ribosomal subunit biogenesis GTPase RsgA 1, mitochondrial-like [Gossypium raimondii]|uniref:small ribosomal subunit biogenesis GTPase RsgA 1, mitochondrial-like n=1 Tax=Gossypium raimondii TaxID=29730 RepID=UPI00063AB4A6|nr:small ribosomal subunit biogenesis GTPase RsgA 1, mitochondrial-like [Gossypium raimondii]